MLTARSVQRAALTFIVLASACVYRPDPDLDADSAAEPEAGGAEEDAGLPAVTDAGCRATASDAGAVRCGSPDGGVPYARVQDVFNRLCVRCHKPGAKIFGGILLTPDESYASLVLAQSNCDAARVLVRPREPEQSVLWLKIANRACGCGRFPDMPPGNDGLLHLPEDFCTIETWIRGGAPP